MQTRRSFAGGTERHWAANLCSPLSVHVLPRKTKSLLEELHGDNPSSLFLLLFTIFFVWVSNKREVSVALYTSMRSLSVQCMELMQFSLYYIQRLWSAGVLLAMLNSQGALKTGRLFVWFCVVLKCFSFGKTAKCLFWDILSRGWCQVQEGFLSPLFSVWACLALNIARATAESQFGRF